MYTSVWLKYLPVIRIVMKRSLVNEQILSLNVEDFERAGAKRKSGYKFSFALKDGRVKNTIIDLPMASDLASLLLSDEKVKDLIASNEFHITMNPKYQLTIRHILAPQLVDSQLPKDQEL